MKKQILLWGIIFSLFLSGCTKEKQIDKLFAKIQTIEEEMHEAQEEIYRLDEAEAVIFEEITSFGNKETKSTEQLVDEALHILEDKTKQMDKVLASFETAVEALDNLEEIGEQLNADSDRQALISLLEKRYKYYEKLHEKQISSITLHEELYESFISEVKVKELKQLLETINDNGISLEKHHEKVNDLTETFNKVVNKE